MYPWYDFEDYAYKITSTSPRGQWVKDLISLNKPVIVKNSFKYHMDDLAPDCSISAAKLIDILHGTI